MKPHPRIRKTIKWGGTVMTVLLVVVWVASELWHIGGGRFPSRAIYYLCGSLWAPALAIAIPTAVVWQFDALARRRERANLCPKCGYDRTGLLKDAKCPECGAAPGSV